MPIAVAAASTQKATIDGAVKRLAVSLQQAARAEGPERRALRPIA